MFELGKCILIINNDRTAGKQRDNMSHVFVMNTYGEILKKTRNPTHTGYRLLAHPQTSSLKPNQMPCRVILLYGVQGSGEAEDVCLIENALETYERWNSMKEIPEYDKKTTYGYKIIGLSMIESVIPRLWGTDCSD